MDVLLKEEQSDLESIGCSIGPHSPWLPQGFPYESSWRGLCFLGCYWEGIIYYERGIQVACELSTHARMNKQPWSSINYSASLLLSLVMQSSWVIWAKWVWNPPQWTGCLEELEKDTNDAYPQHQLRFMTFDRLHSLALVELERYLKLSINAQIYLVSQGVSLQH